MDRIRELEERFLKADEKSGIDWADEPQDGADRSVGEYAELDAFVTIVQNSVVNAYLGIEQLLSPKYRTKLQEQLGDQAESIMRDAHGSLESLVAVLVGRDDAQADIPDEEPVATEEEPTEDETETVLHEPEKTETPEEA